ncbi:MAG: AI-2E family transporter [Candidatus Dojkabacteria bacterium]|jgi:predicted PurR-regulated permease PerM|nr:AI-2E family transporter [Candidatus Dojkabacteria bacterium]MDD4561103.1 AI-2E family transporter [Candidatus Dojkabacteria bacterium]NLB11873.1 AI-2E family transporter [Candidatus Dojkabacteria bacterium]
MPKIYSVKDSSDKFEDNKKTSEIENEKVLEPKTKKSKKETLTIDFSVRVMLFVLLILAFVFFAKQLITVILFLFLGFVLMSSLRPVVMWLRKKGLSKGLSTGLTYVLFFLIVSTTLVLVLVPFLNQLAGLVVMIPDWIMNTVKSMEDITILGYTIDIDTLSQYISDILKGFPVAANVKNIATFISEFFSWGAFLLTSIIFSIYLVSEHDSIVDVLLIRIVSDEKRERVRKLVVDIERKLGSWVLGQAMISTITAVYTGIILTVLQVPFALPLAIFSGFVDVIPSLGSTLSAVAMSLVALITVGPVKAAILLLVFIIYQQLQNNLIIPKLMGNAVGLKSIVILLGVIIFLTFFGLVGAFLAIPLMVILKITYEFYIDLQKLEAKGIV